MIFNDSEGRVLKDREILKGEEGPRAVIETVKDSERGKELGLLPRIKGKEKDLEKGDYLFRLMYFRAAGADRSAEEEGREGTGKKGGAYILLKTCQRS